MEGEDRDVLRLRPGITGPATLKYRLEDEMISDFVIAFKNANYQEFLRQSSGQVANYPKIKLSEAEFEELKAKGNQEIAIWYNDNVIYPDKVRLNCWYYRNYFGNGLSGLIGLKGLRKDLEMIFATVLGRKISFAGEIF